MTSVGILYIATGKYNVLFEDFYISSEKYLLNGYHKKYFIFTNTVDFFTGNLFFKNIEVIRIPNLKWPLPTLLRYKFFSDNFDIFHNISHLIFCNANLKFIDYISLDMIFTNKPLFATLHPGHYKRVPDKFPYETNKLSTAFLSKSPSSIYVCGGFNGGLKDDFLSLSSVINKNISEDLDRDIIALWHDESHFNKFVACNRNLFNILDQSYCCPEFNLIIKNRKIIVRDKNSYFAITDRGFKYIFSSLIKKYISKLTRIFISF
jgi:hypothetical protein